MSFKLCTMRGYPPPRYKQGWLLKYLSEYLYLKVPFVRDYAVQILEMTVE